MNDIVFDFGFFLMEFDTESGQLSGINYGFADLIGRVPVKETIILS